MKKLDQPQVIAILLIIALLLNALIHFTSPAYKFYRQAALELEKRVDTRFDSYTQTVRTNVTDAVVEFYTNVLSIVESRPSQSSIGAFTNSVDSSSSPVLPLVDSINYSYGYADGDIATIGSQHYRVGQVFPRGGLITNISFDSIILDGRYRVANAISRSLQRKETDQNAGN